MNRFHTLTSGLYRGDVSFDFVGRAKQWYILSAVLLLVALDVAGDQRPEVRR